MQRPTLWPCERELERGRGELGFPSTLGPQSSPSLEEGLVRRLPWGPPGEPNSLCDLMRVQVRTPHCSAQANTPFPLPAPGLFLLCKTRRPILPATSTPSLFKHIRTSSVSQRLPAQSQVGGWSDGLCAIALSVCGHFCPTPPPVTSASKNTDQSLPRTPFLLSSGFSFPQHPHSPLEKRCWGFRKGWRRRMTGQPSELQQNKLWVQQQGFKGGPHFLHSPGHHLEELVKYRPSPRPPESESPENGSSDLLLLSYGKFGKHCVGLQEKLSA